MWMSKACTAADVLVTITVGAVDRPVAEAAVGWMIALGHHMRVKDGLVRTGQWNERSQIHGPRIARPHAWASSAWAASRARPSSLLRGFGMNQPLAFDPFAKPEIAARQSASRLVSRWTNCSKQADFVSIHCPLDRKTRGLIGARELALMKPDAFCSTPRAAASWMRTPFSTR